MVVKGYQVEWAYALSPFHEKLGLTKLGEKWAVVKQKGSSDMDWDVLTVVNDRETAVGFIKLLKESK